ncbi:MAG: universal stress protein [Chloroflexi bacterium]|nr:MAG: universal stress protein [Chloroflexota bacterium]
MSVLILTDGSDASRQALTLARRFGDPVHAVHMDAVAPFAPDSLAAILQQVADELNAAAVFAAGTDRGNEVMARLAARAGRRPGCTARVR